MDGEKFQKQLLRRLDVLISLALEMSDSEGGQTMTARMQKLKSYGLRNSEIAAITGKDSGYVSATLAMAKKAKKRAKKGG